MNEKDPLSIEEVKQMFRCKEAQANRHRRAVRTMKGYESYAILTRNEFNEWRELHNTLTTAERKAYFSGFKPETK